MKRNIVAWCITFRGMVYYVSCNLGRLGDDTDDDDTDDDDTDDDDTDDDDTDDSGAIYFPKCIAIYRAIFIYIIYYIYKYEQKR